MYHHHVCEPWVSGHLWPRPPPTTPPPLPCFISYQLLTSYAVNKDFLGISQFFILNEASEICFPFILLNDDVAEEVEQAKVTLQTISTMGFILNTVSANIILIDDEGK